MSEIKKRDLIALVNALNKINDKMMATTNLTSEDYIWCQSQALDLGEYLEGVYFEVVNVTEIISALEDYCEQIYQLSTNDEPELRNDFFRKIKEDLTIASKKMEEIIPENLG